MNRLPVFEQQYPTVGPLIVALADWYRRRRSGGRHSDLQNCTPGDIERIAGDLGLTAADLRALERTADEPLLAH